MTSFKGKRKKLNKKPLYHKCGNCSSCISFKNVFHHIHHPTFFTNFSHLQHSFFLITTPLWTFRYPKKIMKMLVSILFHTSKTKVKSKDASKTMFLLFRIQSSRYQNFFSFFSFHAPCNCGFICEITKTIFVLWI